MLPHLQSRQHQLVSEFSFWPSSPPHDSGYPDGGVFEMRSYKLYPGKLLEWETAWRRGLEARKRFVVSVHLHISTAFQMVRVCATSVVPGYACCRIRIQCPSGCRAGDEQSPVAGVG